MKPEYQAWIEAKLQQGNSPFAQCKFWTLEMQAAFPELERIYGYVVLSNCDIYCHWWLLDENNIVDPTVSQFSGHFYGKDLEVVDYREEFRDDHPTGLCRVCTGFCYEGKACCSELCNEQYRAYIDSSASLREVQSTGRAW